MNKIDVPLNLGMKHPQVSDLQKALTALGFAIAKKEQVDQRFGASTRRALLDFQKEHKLKPTGEVDEKTAGAIIAESEKGHSQSGRSEHHKLPRNSELPEGVETPIVFRVEGTVVSRERAGVGCGSR